VVRATKKEKRDKLLSLKQISIDYNNYPITYIKEQAEEFKNNDDQDIMFVHIRECSEIEKVKELLNAKSLRITSTRVEKILTNSSDANVENIKYDYYIKNDGTIDELKEKAKQFVMEE